jgi:nicotinamide riboside kinase
MKIAIIGTHGSGKTTIINELARELSLKNENFAILPEVPGRCPLPINREGDLKSQMWIMARQIAEELELEHKHEIIICDRSIIDEYIYTLDACERQNTEMPKWLESLFLEHAPTYDFLFKTKMNPAYLKHDGIRDIDHRWQKQIEDKFNEILETHNIWHHKLPEKNSTEYILNKIRTANI